MLEFFKKIFSSKAEETTVPYKVEAPAVAPAVKKTAKKPAVTAKTPRKPRALKS